MAPDSPSLPRQLARTHRFSLGVPGQFTLTSDGSTVLFLRSRGGSDPVDCLWARDVADGTERLLADPAALAPEQGGIGAYATDASGRRIAFALAGRLWTLDLGDKDGDGDGHATPRPLTLDPAAAPPVEPRPDPTGRRIAYRSGPTLRVVEWDGTADRVVAAPEPAELGGEFGADVSFGAPEYVATASMHRTRGYWWSPDGERLLVARVDVSSVQRRWIADPTDPTVRPRAARYPAAGTPNADVSLWLVDADSPKRHQVAWDRAAFEYVTEAGWDEHGPFASVQSRDQRTVRVLAVDPADGTTSRLAEQRDDAWVQLVPGLPARTASGALLTHLDQGDTRHLAVDGVAGTPAGINLGAVLSVDGESVLITAVPADDVFSAHLYRLDLTTGATEQLTHEPDVHEDGVLRAGTLLRPADVPSCAEQPIGELRRTLLRVGERSLCTAVFLPSWYEPGSGERLPVLLDPYAGPAIQRVTEGRFWVDDVSQWFAEQGFVVLAIDGRGVPGRGPRWEREVHLDSFGPALQDQIDALHAVAAEHPEFGLDLDRVAIRGWSFGGSLAEAAVLRRPDVFHAAAAGAGVTDQHLYDTHWRERFLGHPDAQPAAYEACDLLRDAPSLRRPLLLMHGLADDNVYPANTLRLSNALLAAGRPYEFLPLARTGHRVTDEALAEGMLLHQLDFLQRALGL
ncbi:S9 family peptidase [Streptacidiphilus fuscans]|uniref:Prolyl oligopeptidase family serine peptidase n=1 Tax=Streptacidiphilus fuscans TaxID=2789292 RepID=A0A931B1D0_9ACTN|nr:prolyl oligopeptidase family serine peptidase [Streptacidiphilus fuscans]MBF9068443.1 prolyl oligopeptidase family serine peptidase [Streptacidiphilus fuscans]